MSTDLPDVVRALPDYDIGHEIGRGEFGLAWSGRHRQLRREVAIKQLVLSMTATTPVSTPFRNSLSATVHAL